MQKFTSKNQNIFDTVVIQERLRGVNVKEKIIEKILREKNVKPLLKMDPLKDF